MSVGIKFSDGLQVAWDCLRHPGGPVHWHTLSNEGGIASCLVPDCHIAMKVGISCPYPKESK